MQHVAANGDVQPLNVAEPAANGEGIEQSLRWMFVLAIAGIDHRAIDFAREQFGRARRAVAHHQQIRPHRVQCGRRVDQGFALGHAR